MTGSVNGLPSHGILVVDKPSGPTSHDVVARARRTLGIRRIGHAGTLDPLASGVLVVMVGEATKLGPFLTLDDKRYEATVVLGIGTDTLDAAGTVTERRPIPAWFADSRRTFDTLAQCLAAETLRTEQQPPIYSAIKVAGRSAHRLARAGRNVELAPRPVKVHQLTLVAVERAPSVDAGQLPLGTTASSADRPMPNSPATAVVKLSAHVSKGYYVRSLARDIGQRLELPAHLGSLRRLTSGRFGLEGAVGPEATAEQMRAAMIDLSRAATQLLGGATLTNKGRDHARQGQPVPPEDLSPPPASGSPSAWLDERGQLVAIGQVDEDGVGRVLRGFAGPGLEG